MEEHTLIAVASILALGITAQWLAWLFHLPAILLLLAFGFLAGPVARLLQPEGAFLDPDGLFGALLFPVVSISVAAILFEGGLSLRFREIETTRKVVRNLVTVGAAVTWLAAAAAAHWIVGLDQALSMLLGAILVVTGPTVVGPILRQVRPTGKSGSILKWEGIIIDPIGAVLAVLVFEVVCSGTDRSAAAVVALGVFRTLCVGGLLGVIGAELLVLLMRRYWIPDFLQSPVALITAITAFCAANTIQAESGLLSVTVMGILLANQRRVSIAHIVEFKENLRVLLISSLFILLAARVDLKGLFQVGWSGLAFLGLLIVVVRPLAVFISAARSGLGWREKAFIACVAPRGIVAAAVSSVFALRLAEAGRAEADLLVPLTFLVITGTVVVYGPLAPLIARRLGLSKARPQGVLFVGAQPWARAMAACIQAQGFRVLLIDTNPENIAAARMQGLSARLGSVLSEDLKEDLDLDGIGRVVAVTPNDEVNSLAGLHFVDIFGRAEIYQLVTQKEAKTRRQSVPTHLRARALFGREVTHRFLDQRFFGAAEIRTTRLTEKFDFNAYEAHHGETAVPLFLVTADKELEVFTLNDPPTPRPGHVLISLVDRERGGEVP